MKKLLAVTDSAIGPGEKNCRNLKNLNLGENR